MINLLLKRNKKEISKEFTLRFFVIFLVVVFVGLLASFVMLIPSYSLTVSKEISLAKEIDIFKKTIDFRKKNSPISLLEKENEKIFLLKDLDNIYLTDYISEIIDEKFGNLQITGIFYEVDSEKKKILVIKGLYDKRDELIKFSERIEAKKDFLKVDFPVSNLVKNKNSNFSIKIYLNEN